MADSIIKFLEDHIELVDEDKFELLYGELPIEISWSYLTQILYDCGIDPLQSFSYVPTYFAAQCILPSNFKLPENISSIESHAFLRTNLTKIDIPARCETIGNIAFGGCTDLSIVNIGSGLREIKRYAFYGCTKLQIINYEGTLEQWNAVQRADHWLAGNPQRARQVTIRCFDGITQGKQ